jgi:hypothetical protein
LNKMFPRKIQSFTLSRIVGPKGEERISEC